MPCFSAMRRIQWSDLMVMDGWSRVRDDYLGKLDGLAARVQGELRRGLARDLAIHRRNRAGRIGGDRRRAAVGLFADMDVERQRSEQRHAVLRGHACTAARAEDVLG